jgi:hypothetical protein
MQADERNINVSGVNPTKIQPSYPSPVFVINQQKGDTKMADRKTFKVEGNKVTVHHNTITASEPENGEWFDWTLDFSGIKPAEILTLAAEQKVIRMRQATGVKKLSSKEIDEKGLRTKTFVLTETIERVKHEKSAEEKELEKSISEQIKAGISMKDIMAAVRALQKAKEDAELDAGETTE